MYFLFQIFLLSSLLPAQSAPATTSSEIATVTITKPAATAPLPQAPAPNAETPSAPIGRADTDELNKESSSFMGDPDPLDPLPVKKESLKEDEEPILDDIREVLDAKLPAQKKVNKKVTTVKSKKTSKKSSNKSQIKSASTTSQNFSDDDPDLKLEKKFYKEYSELNAQPTSSEAWSTAASGRKAEEYVVIKGDTLWSISNTLFGDPNFWPKLWALNRQGISNPHYITPGLKIYFFPGSPDEIPTLAVGERMNEIKVSENGPSGSEIPDSLPLYRDKRYFLKRTEVKIELDQLPVMAENYENNIFLADKIVSSEIKIPMDSISKERCLADQIIKGVTFKRKPSGPLSIIELVNDLDSPSGKLYAYRIVGDAAMDGPTNLRIADCHSFLTVDTLFAQTSVIPQMKTQKTNNTTEATLLGGPDVPDQNIFTVHQYVYVNLGTNPYEAGQTFSIKSQLTDKVHGKVRIIERFGSYAIGVITSVSNTVSRGDTLITAE
ncbi:MAG: LysM peptidoglycan-binding domain-containing protein [Bdellovibrionaceae bacterium]|nr:LysM peptidoglycan-binding domain-containing protein [Bdellovibrio sp.]